MAGTLSSPNKIKDVYTKLVWYNTSDSKFYRDNGTADVEVPVGSSLVTGNILKHQTASTVTSGDLFQILNNNTSDHTKRIYEIGEEDQNKPPGAPGNTAALIAGALQLISTIVPSSFMFGSLQSS